MSKESCIVTFSAIVLILELMSGSVNKVSSIHILPPYSPKNQLFSGMQNDLANIDSSNILSRYGVIGLTSNVNHNGPLSYGSYGSSPYGTYPYGSYPYGSYPSYGSYPYYGSTYGNQMCPTNMFRCASRPYKCVPMSNCCNGYNDCADRSDEDVLVCRRMRNNYRYSLQPIGVQTQQIAVQMQPIPVQTQPIAVQAQPIAYQPSYSVSVPQPHCPDNQFMCQNATFVCIPMSQCCNGRYDCLDRSDEDRRLCY